MGFHQIKILTIVDYFVPGYRAGGPMRSIVNVVENLGDELEFSIVTRDRDFGMTEPYKNVRINQWNDVGKAKVFYASSFMFSFVGFREILNSVPHDILYLNSFFSPNSTGALLLLRRLGLIKKCPIVIAPRGEFSPGALQLKNRKKKFYIAVVKMLCFYHGLTWQATSQDEAKDIHNIMGTVDKDVLIALNLLSTASIAANLRSENRDDKDGINRLGLVFLSRISPKKNLDYLLRVLQKVTALVEFSIYGVLDDFEYWAKCEELMGRLPANVIVKFRGEVTPEEVPKVFAEHDVFFFPTRGENFGHVIFESLAAGTCVVVSDQTPWKADENGAVEPIPLKNPERWTASLERWAFRSQKELVQCREAAHTYALEYVESSPAVEQNRAMFKFAYNRAISSNCSAI